MVDRLATDRECRIWSRYLAGAKVSPEIVDWYRRSLPSAAVDPGDERPIDRILLAAARVGGPFTRTADGYARLVRPTGPLRRRLTLLLAILENAPETHQGLNRGAEGSGPGVALALTVSLAASALAMVVGLLGFGLLHLVSSPFGRGAAR
jgi:hypothetical protein